MTTKLNHRAMQIVAEREGEKSIYVFIDCGDLAPEVMASAYYSMVPCYRDGTTPQLNRVVFIGSPLAGTTISSEEIPRKLMNDLLELIKEIEL